MVINMKIKKRDEYNEVCKALEKKSEEIELLDETYRELMEKRSDLFSEIILENKLLRGTWKLRINAVPTIILTADKIKKEDDIRKLVNIGFNLRKGRSIHLKTDTDMDITLSGDGAHQRLEICLLFVNDLDELFKFFKDQGIKLRYNIYEFRVRGMKKQIAFLEKLEE